MKKKAPASPSPFSNRQPTNYSHYLQLEKLLQAQGPKSEHHDEMLFILVHQVYELWFKQILHEMDAALVVLREPYVEEKNMGLILQRFERIQKIQHLILQQIDVLETMTPMDFLEFRDFLIPASGFQSMQFREIEIKMGLSMQQRTAEASEFFLSRLTEAERLRVMQTESEPSLYQCIQNWLERFPYTKFLDFDFWQQFQSAVAKMQKNEQEIITKNPYLNDKERELQLKSLTVNFHHFEGLFHRSSASPSAATEDKTTARKTTAPRRLSQKATLSALFILLYRDEPLLQIPFRLLTSLMGIDENFTAWRYRHALMAERMLGNKVGTGGSSGHAYLKHAADNHRVYTDLFNLSSFLIPKSQLPVLPPEILKKLRFEFE
jgi:tryptophan 2,3-dioxygenase